MAAFCFILFLCFVVVVGLIVLAGKLGWGEEAARQQAQIICPHCQAKGKVRTTPVQVKKGISGGKATGAILTGGLSLAATGLSKKEQMTEAHCSNCGQKWRY